MPVNSCSRPNSESHPTTWLCKKPFRVSACNCASLRCLPKLYTRLFRICSCSSIAASLPVYSKSSESARWMSSASCDSLCDLSNAESRCVCISFCFTFSRWSSAECAAIERNCMSSSILKSFSCIRFTCACTSACSERRSSIAEMSCEFEASSAFAFSTNTCRRFATAFSLRAMRVSSSAARISPPRLSRSVRPISCCMCLKSVSRSCPSSCSIWMARV
mmetsp:Transcript_33139/g.82464  ORF Transcript_33139/g.82464 Transcript_33139/m.82464 type:complete len:219 (-) Transcript_33139:785-1441(-)